MQKQILLAAIATTALVFNSGCKQGSGSDSTKSEWIDAISITNNKVKFEYVTTFSNNLEADIEGEFPINRYGSIIFFNDEKGRFNVGFSASYDLFQDINLQEVTTLPNGANFPRIVTGPMYQVVAGKQDGKYKLYAIVDKNAITTTGPRLAGLALEMENISNNFPQISITQSFFKGDTRYASFTLYGPRTVNGVTRPGGLFLVGDINKIINEKTNVWVNQPTVHGPQASKYQDIDAKIVLMKKAQKLLAQNGIYLKFNY